MSYQPPPNGFRTFLIVWATQAVSVFGSALTFFALTIWLTQVLYPRPEQKPELAFALTAISLAFALPTLILAPLAGAWADRHDRKRTMMTADFLNGCVSLGLVTLIATHTLQVWLLIPIVSLVAVLSTYHGAAVDTSYAMLVPEKQLPRANGMMQTIWSLSGILSPGIAAVIIALPSLARQGALLEPVNAALRGLADGSALAITVDAITFFLAAATLLFLVIPSPQRSDVDSASGKIQKSIWADVREGALYIWHRRPMLWLLGTFTVANFAGAPIEVLIPLVLKYDLVGDWTAHGFTFETAFALLNTVFSLGGVAGGFLISAWGGLKHRRIYGVLVPMIISGLAQLVFGFSPVFFLSAGMAFFISAMLPMLNAHSQAIWQTQTPRELQGRVFSVRRVIAQCSWPFGTALAGLAGGLFDPGLVVAMLGGVLVVFCTAQLFNPVLRRVEDKAQLDAMATRAVEAAGGTAPAP